MIRANEKYAPLFGFFFVEKSEKITKILCNKNLSISIWLLFFFLSLSLCDERQKCVQRIFRLNNFF